MWGISSSKFCIFFVRKFSDKKIFLDRLEFKREQLFATLPLPRRQCLKSWSRFVINEIGYNQKFGEWAAPPSTCSTKPRIGRQPASSATGYIAVKLQPTYLCVAAAAADTLAAIDR